MPIYEYQCDGCQEVFEVFQKVSDPAPTQHTCGSTQVHRVLSNTSFVLKGTGWYITDYGRKDKGSDGAKSQKDSDGGSDSKSETSSDKGSGSKDTSASTQDGSSDKSASKSETSKSPSGGGSKGGGGGAAAA